MKFYIKNFGCKVNQSDGAGISKILEENGFKREDIFENSNNIIINSCAVTSKAVRKTRQYIHLIKRKSSANIFVTGCAAFINEIENEDRVTVCSDLKDLFQCFGINKFELTSSTDPNRTRAYLKIQDGCENFCSYCIIPYTRGKLKSISLDKISKQTDKLILAGYKEIVLIGIHLGLYGKDKENICLEDAVLKCLKNKNLLRLRLGSIEPNEITDNLIDIFKNNKVCAKHFHIPLQSGSTEILKKMNRKYTKEDFKNKIDDIRRAIPNIELTTDIIIGFPGETEKNIKDTIDMCNYCEFSNIHIFPFSKRFGTKAYSMENKIDPKIILNRVKILTKLKDELIIKRRKKYLNKKVEILIERIRDNIAEGFNSQYIKCEFNIEKETKCNEIVNAKVINISDNILKTEIL